MNFQPKLNFTYPPFQKGRFFEEYFFDYWNKQQFSLKEKITYLDVFWCNLFHTTGKTQIPELTSHVQQQCSDNKLVFTICQWDDNICIQNKPKNLIVYSIGTSYDVPLPLIVEDITSRLECVPRIPFIQKNILCSFVGTNTHSVRNIICQTLNNNPDFSLHMKQNWELQVNENLMDLFISITQKSKFALAPRGYGPSSFRFFEIIQMGVIPVYVHDGDNALPFKDIIDYDKCCIVIHINDISKLPSILQNISHETYKNMLHELEKISVWFTMEGTCEYIKRDIIHRLLA